MTPTVDVHAHALVPAAEAAVAGQPGLARQRELDLRGSGAESAAVNQAQLTRIGPLLTEPARRLAAMDDAGVDIQVVSPMPLYHYWADPVLAERITRITNDGIAAVVAERPDRLLGLGTAPLQHPDLATDELTRAITEYGLRGVQIGTSAGGRELADDALDGFWERAAELRAVVFIHPWGCSLGERLDRYYLSNTVGNPVETTVALSQSRSPGCWTATRGCASSPPTAAATCPPTSVAPTTPGGCGPRPAAARSHPAATCAGSGSTRSSTPRPACAT